jgi:omega-6 fatty acid desaturase (delta-12 desaturase)
MPHYNAREATLALRQKFGEDVILRDSTPIITALFRSWNDCVFVEDDGDVLWWRKDGQ